MKTNYTCFRFTSKEAAVAALQVCLASTEVESCGMGDSFTVRGDFQSSDEKTWDTWANVSNKRNLPRLRRALKDLAGVELEQKSLYGYG